MIRLKRIYEPPAPADGRRILVERLWPRGLSKARAAVDVWLKEVAPSPELRKWYGHDVARWEQFRKRYWKELDANTEAVDALRDELKKGAATLVFAAKDEAHNSAAALKAYLEHE